MTRAAVQNGDTVRAIVSAIATIALAACGRSPITSNRIETAIQNTFANLVQLQVSRLGLPPMPAPDFAVTAICSKQPNASDEGAGEWTCTLVWQGPDRRTLRDNYDLTVGTDGCFAASVSGESLGGPTLRAPDGRTVRNLLYAFEGCFDTT
jgi:hypothetical protein